MTKRVFSNEALTHQWAHDSIERECLSGNTTIGRGSSTSYTVWYPMGDAPDVTVSSFFSYRTEVAYRISPTATAPTSNHLPPLFLLDTTTYSSTSRHQYYLRSAVFGPDVYNLPRPDPSNMQRCRDDVMGQVKANLKLAAKACTKRDEYIAQASTLIDTFNSALSALRVRGVQAAGVDHIDPTCVGNADLAAIAVLVKAEAARSKQQEAERLERLREVHEAYCTAWRKRETPEDGATLVWGLPTPLRLSEDGTMVETARHAEIPVKHAKRLWPVLQQVRAASPTEKTLLIGSIIGVKLGVYTLNAVSEQGDITVGCHQLAYEEMQLIAQQLGLTTEHQQMEANSQ